MSDYTTEMLSDFLRDAEAQLARDAARGANPRRVAAGRLNRAKRGPLTESGRERLRAAALAKRPWEHSTGPRTDVGKIKSSSNGKLRQMGEFSRRELRNIEHELLSEFVQIMGARMRITAEFYDNKDGNRPASKTRKSKEPQSP